MGVVKPTSYLLHLLVIMEGWRWFHVPEWYIPIYEWESISNIIS
jgi:hypothetical protein